MVKSLLCVLLLLITLPAAAAPHRVQSEDVSKLTGGGHREWVYGGYDSWSNGSDCKGSDVWVFHYGRGSSGSFTKKMCRDKRLVVEYDHSWSVYTNAQGAVAINVDGTAYELRFESIGSRGLKMLFTQSGGSKSDGYRGPFFIYKPAN